MMLVMKFGGTSVKNAEAVDRVSGIISARVSEQPIVVVSATGDTTDRLVEILDLIDDNKPGAMAIAEVIEQKHIELIKEVVTDAAQQKIAFGKVEPEIDRLKDMISAMERLGDVSMRSRDAVQALGERMSAPILAASLASRGINAVSVDPARVIATDSNFGAAKPDFTQTAAQCQSILVPLCGKGQVPVIGGFVGSNGKGIITTLGRGGSDLTASVIAKSVSASGLEFWKDVDGILTADPRIVPDARPLSEITFEEAAELTFLGSGVLHPASIQPAVEAGVPVTVRNSYRKDSPGTKILKTRPEGVASGTAASIAYKKNQALINVYSTRMIGASGFLRKVFEVFDRLKISVDHIATSEVNITVTVDDGDVVAVLAKELEEVATVTVTHNVSIVSVVGDALRQTAGIGARIFTALKDINILFSTHSGATTNLSVGIENDRLTDAITSLHHHLFD
ncbi:MAG: aspartate kinase [Deltaproteobacteria bacterium]|nr:aspartate kinase [Deltaproteobacteria bacterium]